MSEAELRAEQANVIRERDNCQREQSDKQNEKTAKEQEKANIEAEQQAKIIEKQQKEIEKANQEEIKANKEIERDRKEIEILNYNTEIAIQDQQRSINETALSTANQMRSDLQTANTDLQKLQFLSDSTRENRVRNTTNSLDQATIDLTNAQDQFKAIDEKNGTFDLTQPILNQTTQNLITDREKKRDMKDFTAEELEKIRLVNREKIKELSDEELLRFEAIKKQNEEDWKMAEDHIIELVANFKDLNASVTSELKKIDANSDKYSQNEKEQMIAEKIKRLRESGRNINDGIKQVYGRAMSIYVAKLDELERSYFEEMTNMSLDPMTKLGNFVKVCNEYRAIIRDNCLLIKIDGELIPPAIIEAFNNKTTELINKEKLFNENPVKNFLEYCYAFENYIEFAKDYCIGDPKEIRDFRHKNTKERRLGVYQSIRSAFVKAIENCDKSINELNTAITDMSTHLNLIDRNTKTLTDIQQSPEYNAMAGHVITIANASQSMGRAAAQSQEALAVEKMTDVYKVNGVKITLRPYQVTIADAFNKADMISIQVKRFVAAVAEIGPAFLNIVKQAKTAGIYDKDIHERIKEILELNKLLIGQLYDNNSETKYDANGSGPLPSALSDVIVKNMRAYQRNKRYNRNLGTMLKKETFESVGKDNKNDSELQQCSVEHLTRLKNVFGGFDDIYYNQTQNNTNNTEHFSGAIKSVQKYEQIFGSNKFYKPDLTITSAGKLLGQPTRFNPFGLVLNNSEIEAYVYIQNIIGDYEERVRYKNQNTIDYLLRSLQILSDLFEKKQKLKHQGYEVVLQGTINQMKKSSVTADDPDLEIKILKMIRKKLEHQKKLFSLNTSISTSIRGLLQNLRTRVKGLKSVMHVYLEVGFGNNANAVTGVLQNISLPELADIEAVEEKYKDKLNEIGVRATRDNALKQLPVKKIPIIKTVITPSSVDPTISQIMYYLDAPYKLKRMDNGNLTININTNLNNYCMPITGNDGVTVPCERYRSPHVINVTIEFIRSYPVQIDLTRSETREDKIVKYTGNIIVDMESEGYTINLKMMDLKQIQNVTNSEQDMSNIIDQTIEVSKNIISTAVQTQSKATQFTSEFPDQIKNLNTQITGTYKAIENTQEQIKRAISSVQATIAKRQNIKQMIPEKLKRIDEMIKFIQDGN
jgi:hypothetical protein